MPRTPPESRPAAEPRRRTSRQRDAIRAYLDSVEHHPTAEEIHRAVRKKVPSAGLATVYRNLEQMIQSGEASRTIHGDRARYDGRSDAHYHFFCDSCGRLDNIETTAADKRLLASLSRRVHGSIESIRLEVHGRCSSCRRPGR
jgi:Fe2+ or Zn2+ uptake regulation protein